MSRSSLYTRAGTELQRPADTPSERQLSAKLHCLFGIPSSNVGRRVLSAHPFARSKVYDLRNYTEGTGWGPFLNDGNFRVDWEMVESLMIVLGYNSGLCCRRFQPRFSPPWVTPLQGVVPEKDKLKRRREWDVSMLSEVDVPLRMRDPYNISGVWSRVRLQDPILTYSQPRKGAKEKVHGEADENARSSAFSTITTFTPSISPKPHLSIPPPNRATPSLQTKLSATSSWTSKSRPLPLQKTRPTPSLSSRELRALSTQRGIRMRIQRFGDRYV